VIRVAVSDSKTPRDCGGRDSKTIHCALSHLFADFPKSPDIKNALNSRVKLILDVDETLTGSAHAGACHALTKH
jgi:hypothetical protein